MRIATGLAFAALMLGACGGEPPAAPAAPAPVAEAPAPAPEVAGPNTLTAEQTAAGWKLLFNGVDLTGWKGYKKDKPGDAWKVEDGALVKDAAQQKAILAIRRLRHRSGLSLRAIAADVSERFKVDISHVTVARVLRDLEEAREASR